MITRTVGKSHCELTLAWTAQVVNLVTGLRGVASVTLKFLQITSPRKVGAKAAIPLE